MTNNAAQKQFRRAEQMAKVADLASMLQARSGALSEWATLLANAGHPAEAASLRALVFSRAVDIDVDVAHALLPDAAEEIVRAVTVAHRLRLSAEGMVRAKGGVLPLVSLLRAASALEGFYENCVKTMMAADDGAPPPDAVVEQWRDEGRDAGRRFDAMMAFMEKK